MSQPESEFGLRRAQSSRATTTDGALAPVIRLRPIRTLVVARDLGFRQRVMIVLEDLGPVSFAVVSLDDVVALVERQQADVVVLDATACAPGISRIVERLYGAAPEVGVVVVSDDAQRGLHAIHALPKWGWASDLRTAVAQAYDFGNPFTEDLSDACS